MTTTHIDKLTQKTSINIFCRYATAPFGPKEVVLLAEAFMGLEFRLKGLGRSGLLCLALR